MAAIIRVRDENGKVTDIPAIVGATGKPGEPGKDGEPGEKGEAGGYYTPSVTQEDDTLRFSFAASEEDMPTVGDVTVSLPGGFVDLDTTLTQSGKAADAKAVGDALANVDGKAYVQSEEPVDAPVGALWLNPDEEGENGGASVDIPAALPNPHKLTFSGAVSAEYDGSAAVNVVIPAGGGGSSGGDTWKLLHTLTLTEDTKYITQELGGSYDAVCIAFTNLWCVEGTTCGVAAAVNSGSVDTGVKSASMGGFINNSNYPAKGCVEIEKFGDVCRMIISGVNSAGNYSGCGVGAVTTDVSGGIARIQFSLAAYGTHTMNAGAVIRIYGR